MGLACADDVNLLGNKVHIRKKNIETSTYASKEVDLKVNVVKIKHMLLFTRMQVRIVTKK
jgi:hypothetical protein